MAGATNPEFPPLLRPGFHAIGIDGVRRLCVDRFAPQSLSRERIMKNLETIIDLMQQNGMRGDVWIDGSFVTEKLNPDDTDIVLVVTRAELISMNTQQRDFLTGLGRRTCIINTNAITMVSFSTQTLLSRNTCMRIGCVNLALAEKIK